MQRMAAVEVCENQDFIDLNGSGLGPLGPADDQFFATGECRPYGVESSRVLARATSTARQAARRREAAAAAAADAELVCEPLLIPTVPEPRARGRDPRYEGSMASEQPAPRFFLILMTASSALLLWVLYPMASELLLAAVLAVLLWPVRQWLSRRMGGRSNLASGIVTVGVVLLVLGPLAGLVTTVIRDGSDGIRFVSNAAHSPDVTAMVDTLPDSARDAVKGAISRLPRDLGEVVEKVDVQGKDAAAAVGAAMAATGSLVLSAALMVIALFFLLARGPELVRWLDSISPLGRGQTLELLDTFKKVSIAVIVSTVITAAVQAAAALVGYLITQVPNPIFFGSVTFFVALIPAIGAAAVCLVAALLLFVTGHPYMAIFLAAWGVIVVGLVDNLVKPLLIKRGMELHGAVVFFSLIGGLAAFGAIGLVIGPIVVALFLALLRMYHRDYTPHEQRLPAVPGLRGAATLHADPFKPDAEEDDPARSPA